MIKLEKKAVYYLRSKYHHANTKETTTFYNMQEALQTFESVDPCYYINKKDFSIIEEITLYYPTEYGIRAYYKRIDPNDEKIETNYKKEE